MLSLPPLKQHLRLARFKPNHTGEPQLNGYTAGSVIWTQIVQGVLIQKELHFFSFIEDMESLGERVNNSER